MHAYVLLPGMASAPASSGHPWTAPGGLELPFLQAEEQE